MNDYFISSSMEIGMRFPANGGGAAPSALMRVLSVV